MKFFKNWFRKKEKKPTFQERYLSYNKELTKEVIKILKTDKKCVLKSGRFSLSEIQIENIIFASFSCGCDFINNNS